MKRIKSSLFVPGLVAVLGATPACSAGDDGVDRRESAGEPGVDTEAAGAESLDEAALGGEGTRLTEADFAVMSEDERLAFVANAFGWRADEVQVDGDRLIVEGDILVSRDQIDRYIRAYLSGNMKKAYMCNSTAGNGANGFGCFEMLATHTNSIRMVINGSVSEGWRQAFVEAAYVVGSMTLFNVTTSISIDTTGFRSNQWTINVTTANLGGNVALSSWPTWNDVDFVAPGSLIQINTGDASGLAFRRYTALHELLHAFGYHHPGIASADHMDWTSTWTNASSVCNAAGGGTYPTVMCTSSTPTFTFLSIDDELGGLINYPGTVYDRDQQDNERCTPSSPCGIGEGDCDVKDDCEGYLVCSQNVSADLYGLPSGWDVCVAPSTPRGEGGAACNTATTNARCNDAACPCGAGEGDCDSETQCGSGLLCPVDNGPAIGANSTYEVCTHPRPPGCTVYNKSGPVDWSLCTPTCPCSYGEGDCDTDADCVGNLVCAQNSGASYGLQADLDLCAKAGVFP